MVDGFIGSTAGVTLRIRRLTEPGGAPVTVLFAHATGFCAETWDPMAGDTALKGIAAVSFDFRAHGSSTRPDDGDLSWSGMADDVLAVIDHLAAHDAGVLDGRGERATRRLVGAGHSMGGAALLLAEQRRPGTFDGIWCYEPVVFPPGAVGGSDDNPLAAGAARRRPDFASAAAAIENFASKPPMNRFRPDAVEAYVQGGFRELPDGSVTLRCRPDDEARVFRMAPQSHVWDALGSIRCPTVVLRGGPSPPGPAAFAAPLVEALPAGRLEEHDELGHFGPMEAPAAMAASLAALISDVTAPE